MIHSLSMRLAQWWLLQNSQRANPHLEGTRRSARKAGKMTILDESLRTAAQREQIQAFGHRRRYLKCPACGQRSPKNTRYERTAPALVQFFFLAGAVFLAAAVAAETPALGVMPRALHPEELPPAMFVVRTLTGSLCALVFLSASSWRMARTAGFLSFCFRRSRKKASISW